MTESSCNSSRSIKDLNFKKKDIVSPDSHTNKIRFMVQQRFINGLIGKNDANKYYKYKQIAKQIEDHLYKYCNHETSEKYKQKYRDIIFNLCDSRNSSLNLRILKEQISPRRLITMTFEELASDKLKIRREKNRHWDIQASRSDLHKNVNISFFKKVFS